MDYQTDPRAIIIKDVKPEGAVMHWNRSNPPSVAVQAGDRVVGVNHVGVDTVDPGVLPFPARRHRPTHHGSDA